MGQIGYCPMRTLCDFVLLTADVRDHRPATVQQRLDQMRSNPLAASRDNSSPLLCHSGEDTRIGALVKLSLSDRLRSALASPAQEPLLVGDFPELRAQAAIHAAVLIAITDRPNAGIILTERHERMRTHAGQIAFPGGRAEPGETPVDAALRESFEELALDPSAVEVVGALDEYRTVSGFVITPVVGVIPPDLRLEANEAEVAGCFEAPLDYLLDPANQRAEKAVFGGRERHYWVIEWGGKRIWGATAAILVNLARRLKWNG
jgi:8-oxo-dGTP pyrophosphatase MutT (NUDIX family)